MGARLFIIGSVASKNKPQMCSAKYDDLIKAFAPKRADETFGNSVLPWRSGGDWSVANSHRPHPAGEDMSVGAVIVTDQILWCRSPGNASVICRANHSAVGCRATSNHNSCRRPWPRTRKTNSRSNVTVGIIHISIAAIASAWLRRNVFQLCDGGLRPRTTYFDTVDWATSKPSINSSPWIRDAPHNGLFRLIRWISSRRPRSILGRPARCPDFQRQ